MVKGNAEQRTTTPHIRVRNGEDGTAISTDLWGVFFEDINYSADGGLYAELIENRSFEYTSADRLGWTGLTGWVVAGEAFLSLSTADPFESTSPHYAVVSTSGPGTLMNSGFGGIHLVAGESYRLRITTRQSTGAAVAVQPRLEDPDGHVLAIGDPIRPTDSWQAFTVDLTCLASASSSRLALGIGGPAEVAFDCISLFPVDTFRGDDNGLRSDLATAISELRPRFIRFPGGCVAHGLGIENIYRWNLTVGPLEKRRQMFNLWGYHQSMGLGYFEYFRFCEQIGAKPLPVLAAGVCCQNLDGGAVPIADDDMAAYIEEVLGLVEYANGPVRSHWGAIRAAAGHPEPFGLEYLAIGNEDEQTAMFRTRFAAIHAALGIAHPEITVVGTVGPSPFGTNFESGWEFARELGVQIVDEHSYKSPRWLFENVDRFDSYDRSGPAVYLGEYGSKGNTVLNALAEAAFMMGMERNGDIVRLASYAPLLAKLDHTQWVPDLIYFDNDSVLPTVNYYVQKMHSESSGDRSIPVQVDDAPTFVRSPSIRTSLAVRAAEADVEFTNVRLNDSDPVGLIVSGETREVLAPLSLAGADDYVITLSARLTKGRDGFAIAFGQTDSPNHFEWHFGTWKNRFSTLYAKDDGDLDELLEPVPFGVARGREYQVEVRVTNNENRIVCLLDGNVVHNWTRGNMEEKRFTATAVHDSTTSMTWLKVVNATPRSVQSSVEFDVDPGAVRIVRTVLAGDPGSGKPFEESPVVPLTDMVARLDDSIVFPPFSFTILRYDPDESDHRPA